MDSAEGSSPPQQLLDRLQLLAGFKAHGFSRRNRNLSASAWITSDSSFSRTNVEYTKSAQFNAIAFGERALHALKNSLHSHFSFGFGDTGSVDDLVDDVEFNHVCLAAQELSNASSY